jgi:hypothetical protein
MNQELKQLKYDYLLWKEIDDLILEHNFKAVTHQCKIIKLNGQKSIISKKKIELCLNSILSKFSL